jgi:hypothetical protein
VPILGPAPIGQTRNEVGGNPSIPQTSAAGANAGVSGNANAGVAANQSGDRWRYRWHNGAWWYWTPENRWIYSRGSQWFNYDPAVVAVPGVRYSGQPAYGYYPGPYRYSVGYGGYYGPVYQGGYYYGPGGYYSQPGVSVGLGFGRGLRIGF